MAICDDEKNVISVSQHLTQELRKQGWDHMVYPGFEWIRQMMCDEDLFTDGSIWDEPRYYLEYLYVLVDKTIEWLTEKGLRQKAERGEPRAIAATSVGQSYASARAVSKLVQELRERFWGTTEAPFANSLEGRQQAVKWFAAKLEDDHAALGEKRPGTYEIVVTVSAQDFSRELYKLMHLGDLRLKNLHSPALSKGPADPRQWAQTFTEVVDGKGISIEHVMVEGAYGNHMSHPELVFVDFHKKRWKLPAYPGTALFDLHTAIRAICRATVWWTEQEALEHVMHGVLPVAAIHVQRKRTFAATGSGPSAEEDDIAQPDDEGTRHRKLARLKARLSDLNLEDRLLEELTITVRGPATPGEVEDAYKNFLKANNLNPKRLSNAHRQLIQLVHETPDLSWQERYQEWLKLCEQDKSLPRYGSPQGSRTALRTEFKRAVQRAGWGKEGVWDEVSKLLKLKPKVDAFVEERARASGYRNEHEPIE